MDQDQDVKKSYTGLVLITALIAIVIMWMLGILLSFLSIAFGFIFKNWLKILLGLVAIIILRRILFRAKGKK